MAEFSVKARIIKLNGDLFDTYVLNRFCETTKVNDRSCCEVTFNLVFEYKCPYNSNSRPDIGTVRSKCKTMLLKERSAHEGLEEKIKREKCW